MARDWEAHKDRPPIEPGEATLARAHSRALNALYGAEAVSANAGAAQSFQELLVARGMDVPTLAREIGGVVGIARSVLADLINGAMRGPVARRFVEAVTRALSITPETFHAALDRALAAPRLGHAKATTVLTVHVRSYEEVIRSSGMAPDQIRYWLSDD